MNMKLKDILNELNQADPLKTQIYMDLDGVMVDLNKGFAKISGGFTPGNFKDAPQFGGDVKRAKKQFWYLIGKTPNFWENLEPMPDAHVLWDYVTKKFTDPKPVVLTAGQGTGIQMAKTRWVEKHLGTGIQVFLAPMGSKKPESIIKQENTRHILIDDTIRNIEAWDKPEQHQFAILHKNAAESIRLLSDIVK